MSGASSRNARPAERPRPARTFAGEAQRIDLHPPAATAIETPERQVDQAFVLRRVPFHDRPIGLCDLALLEQEAELFERLVVAPEHQAARRVAIEPVHEGGVARQTKAQRRKIIFDIFAAFRAAMDRDPGRLVDDQHQPVAIEKPRDQLFPGHAGRER